MKAWPTPTPRYRPSRLATAIQKVQAAEDAWNTRDPEHVSLAYTVDSQWRNRDEHIVGREPIVAFPHPQMAARTRLCLRKSLWSFQDNQIAVRFQYECRDAAGQWYRSYGNDCGNSTRPV